MPLTTSKKQKSLPPLNGPVFYIVGTRRLENELMASYLERQSGDPCFVAENVSHIPTYNPKTNGRPKLLFWDCQGNNFKSLLTELRAWNIRNPSAKTSVLFNVPSDLEFKKKFILEGILGLFYEKDSLDLFMKGVQSIIDGKLWLPRDMMTKCIFEGTGKDNSSKNQKEKLSERQIEILAIIAAGATNDEIADRLCISPHTVKKHLYSIFKKINVSNRIQAALWAASNL